MERRVLPSGDRLPRRYTPSSRGGLRLAPDDLPPSLREIVDYRKSGLSLNHVVGCPLDCGYCVRHLFDNFDMKAPHLVVDDETAVERLIAHPAFRPGITPVQILNRATDPFLPKVKDHLFGTLEALDRRRLTNHALVITRWSVDRDDVERLERLRHIRPTVLVTWSGIEDTRIEPVDGAIAEASLRTLHRSARRTRKVLYWRPLVAGLNDGDGHLARARGLSFEADATVFTGLFHRDAIRDHFRAVGVPDLYDAVARRKIMPRDVERRVIAAFAGRPLFRKTSCGVAYAHRVPDYNGHYGVRDLCGICPADQVSRCRSVHQVPCPERVDALAVEVGLDPDGVSIGSDAITVAGSTEQQRYRLQHALNFQVHDREHPHRRGRHGRADTGWD